MFAWGVLYSSYIKLHMYTLLKELSVSIFFISPCKCECRKPVTYSHKILNKSSHFVGHWDSSRLHILEINVQAVMVCQNRERFVI